MNNHAWSLCFILLTTVALESHAAPPTEPKIPAITCPCDRHGGVIQLGPSGEFVCKDLTREAGSLNRYICYETTCTDTQVGAQAQNSSAPQGAFQTQITSGPAPQSTGKIECQTKKSDNPLCSAKQLTIDQLSICF